MTPYPPSSESSSLTCPLCCRRNWAQFNNDCWRLEQWLQHSEATQASRTSLSTAIEALEEAAQDHRVRGYRVGYWGTNSDSRAQCMILHSNMIRESTYPLEL